MTVALIDADILVYESAYRCQQTVEWEPGEYTQHASFDEGTQDFYNSVKFIVESVGADSAILALTDSDREANFRRKVWPGYKAHRESPGDNRPLLYKALRDHIRENYTVRQKPGIEADDTIGILATGEDIKDLPPVEERVICSIDKDLDTVPGRHFNWRKPELGVYYIHEPTAFYALMLQTLCGDKTDGYPGLPGVGQVRATRLLDSLGELFLKSDLDYYKSAMWHAVVTAFEKHGLTEDDAVVQARCARILQACDWDWEKNEPVLWEPPKREMQ